MTKEFKREEKFFVANLKYLEVALTDQEWGEFWKLADKVEEYRKSKGKKRAHYVVVNEDEEYSEVIWKIIEMGEKNK